MKLPIGIHKVEIDSNVYYQVKGCRTLHKTVEAATKQKRGMKDANKTR